MLQPFVKEGPGALVLIGVRRERPRPLSGAIAVDRWNTDEMLS